MNIMRSISHGKLSSWHPINNYFSSLPFYQHIWKGSSPASLTYHTFSTKPRSSSFFLKLCASFMTGTATYSLSHNEQIPNHSPHTKSSFCMGENIPVLPKNTLSISHTSQQKHLEWDTIFHEAKLLQEGIQNNTIDIQHTHVPFLANMLRKNFSLLFSEEYFVAVDPKQQQEVEEARKEMQHHIQEKTVSYAWWLFFHARLALIATAPENRRTYRIGNVDYGISLAWKPSSSWSQEEFSLQCLLLKSHLKQGYPLPFPIAPGLISIAAINRTVGSPIFPIGLVNGPKLADNNIQYPSIFFCHDIDHYHDIPKDTQKKLLTTRQHFEQARNILLSMQNAIDATCPIDLSSTIKLLDFCFFYVTHEADLVHALQTGPSAKTSALWTSITGAHLIVFPFSILLAIYSPAMFITVGIFGMFIDIFFFRHAHRLNSDFFQDRLLNTGDLREAVPCPDALKLPSYAAMSAFGFDLLQKILQHQQPLTQQYLQTMIETSWNDHKNHQLLSTSPEYQLQNNSFYETTILNRDKTFCNTHRLNLINTLLSAIHKMSRSLCAKNIDAVHQALSHIQEQDPKLFYQMINHPTSKLSIMISYYEMRYEHLLNKKIHRFMDYVDASYT